MEHFRNNGYGWECRRCGAEEHGRAAAGPRARFFSEGEAEAISRNAGLDAKAIAQMRREKVI